MGRWGELGSHSRIYSHHIYQRIDLRWMRKSGPQLPGTCADSDKMQFNRGRKDIDLVLHIFKYKQEVPDNPTIWHRSQKSESGLGRHY